MRGHTKIWPVLLALLVALSLEVAPLPASVDILRPPWMALTLIFWSMRQPGRFGVGVAWTMGLVLDVLTGSVLGQHALMLALSTYLTITFYQRLRVFPIWQQTLAVTGIISLYTLIGFWIDGMTSDLDGGVLRLMPIVSGLIVWPPLYWISDRLITPLMRD